MKILLVEDEKLLSKAITKGLKKSGYAVDDAYDGEQALEFFEINSYDIVVLDLNIPKIDGIEVLRRIRGSGSAVKILILSARSEVHDKIIGLDNGANDYLAKPFDFDELCARIRNLLRWEFTQKDAIINCGELRVDTTSKIVKFNEQNIELTKKEYSIIEYLAHHKGEIVSAEQIIEHVWDSETDLFSNTFKFHIHSLKKKLALYGVEPIKNVRGQGYIIEV